MTRSIFLCLVTCILPVSAYQDVGSVSEGTTINTILRLERLWERALRNGDQATIDRLVAPDCVFISSAGRIVTKDEVEAEHRRRLRDLASSTIMEIKVRALGDTAIVVGMTREVDRGANLVDAAQYRWTHVFLKQDDRWRVVSVQTTPVLMEDSRAK